MLKIVADEDQIVKREWIRYYDEVPENQDDYKYTAIAVDLAISQEATADFTSIIIAHIYGQMDTLKVFILPFLINERLGYPETIEKIKQLSLTCALGNSRAKIFIEQVGYQESIIQQLKKESYLAEGFKVSGQDKRARLSAVTPYIMQGKVLFPKNSAENLIQQMLGFGAEKHDDLVDAFTTLMHMVTKHDLPKIKLYPYSILDPRFNPDIYM